MPTFRETFGESAIDFASISKSDIKESFISTGSRTLNRILTGYSDVGIVRSRIYELYGTEGCGKTTLTLESIVSCQKKEGKAMFVDAEHALDIEYAERIGVNFKALEFGQPDCGEEAMEMMLWGIENEFDLIVGDSVAAFTPRAELEGEMDKDFMGIHARLMGKGLRKIVSKLGKKNPSAIIFINQIRSKIGVMFGNPEVTPGGRALKFFASVRIDLRDPRGQKVVEGGEEVGKVINAKTVKNKIYPPFKKCKIHLTYGHGIDRGKDLVQALVDAGLAEATKKMVKLSGEKQMNYSTFIEKIRSDKKFRERILGKLSGE